MEFSSRGFQRNTTRPAAAPNTVSGSQSPEDPKKPAHKRAIHKIKSSTILSLVFFLSILILVVAVILGISTKSSENSVVQKNRYQAVFLNGGQAYFGKITNLNDRFIDLSDIYYISTNGQTGENAQANISLIKLGSELHCPQDRMIINREQVLFWENLNDDGKVVNAIKQWQKEHPDGQKCNNQTTQQQTPTQGQNSGESQNNNSDSRNPNSTDPDTTEPSSDTPTSNTPSTSTPSTNNSNTSSTPNPTQGGTNPANPTP